MNKIISTLILGLCLASNSVFAKTESMYINGENKDVTEKTLVVYPPSIDRLASQVGEPNFDVFYPKIENKNNISLFGKIEPMTPREVANGAFVTVKVPKGEYGRILVSDYDDNTPDISYTYTSEKLYSIKLDFQKEVNSGNYHKKTDLNIIKELLIQSLSASGFRNEDVSFTEDSYLYAESYVFVKGGKTAILLIPMSRNDILSVSLHIYDESYDPDKEVKVEERFDEYKQNAVKDSTGNLLKLKNNIK